MDPSLLLRDVVVRAVEVGPFGEARRRSRLRDFVRGDELPGTAYRSPRQNLRDKSVRKPRDEADDPGGDRYTEIGLLREPS